MAENVRVERSDDGRIVEVILDRPEKKNAITPEIMDQLTAVGQALTEASDLRAVILRGEGGDFCAGMDTAVFMQFAGNLDAVKHEMLHPPAGQIGNRFQMPCLIWQQVPVPVIAVLEGVCLGGGAQIALGADLRVAAPDLRFSIKEMDWGLIPDMGLTRCLPGLMPADRALATILTAPMLSGSQAQDAGLVTEIADDPLVRARALAQEIAGRSPDAVVAAKRLVNAAWRDARADETLRLEAKLQAALMGAPNQIEAVMARLGKRAPEFTAPRGQAL